MDLDPNILFNMASAYLGEDLGRGDVTTQATVRPATRGRGRFLAKQPLVVAGLEVAEAIFTNLEPGMELEAFVYDGESAEAGRELARIEGPAQVLLMGERVALNLLQRMSGIATATRADVTAAAGRITILDTRKTTPTLRALEKYAVRAGGGTNHRFGLYDLILIKDKHVRQSGGVARAIAQARAAAPGMRVEVEAQTVDEAAQAADAGADIILLDNLSTPEIRQAVAMIAGRARTEISGGVTLDRIAELATTGADFVSVGALTHSVHAADISLEIEPVA
jgi:nicotinate-nucleotide pyrophosphorylase (carboxylating)